MEMVKLFKHKMCAQINEVFDLNEDVIDDKKIHQPEEQEISCKLHKTIFYELNILFWFDFLNCLKS
jgi:hypothetical protein